MGIWGVQSIAETFAALTRLPVQPRIHPSEAVRIITENLLAHFEVVTLETTDYLQALEAMKQGGWSGAKIYDALLLASAAKCNPERIYSFNSGDFMALASKTQRGKVCAP